MASVKCVPVAVFFQKCWYLGLNKFSNENFDFFRRTNISDPFLWTQKGRDVDGELQIAWSEIDETMPQQTRSQVPIVLGRRLR